jgi:NAD(P)H-flavin reductase
MHPVHHVVPQPARIAGVEPESADTRTFSLALERDVPAFDTARPGQFVMLSIPGHGEAAFTLSSLPRGGGAAGRIVVTVRRVGELTSALFDRPLGARVGVRGPFGRGFPESVADLPTLYVAGGCGLAPLKAAIDTQIHERARDRSITILYGARHPGDRIHRAALAAWARVPAVRVLEVVERPTTDWAGRTGTLADHLDEALDPLPSLAAVCGPPAMLGPVANRLRLRGIAADRILVAIERQMKCATGECGHCYVGSKYACRDGPVFSLVELDGIPDAFGHPSDSWNAGCR